MTPLQMLIAAAIGLVAGLVGGLCGIGGSIIMLPALALIFGYDDREQTQQHVYIAAALLVNTVVAATAVRTHLRAKAIDKQIVLRLLPPMILSIVGGVVLGNRVDGRIPKLVLVGFLFAFVAWTLFTAIRRLPEPAPEDQRATGLRLGAIGLVAGVLAGFLGIGGGIVMVPAMQLLARVPLRRAIAASAAAMCVTAPIGAITKFGSLANIIDAAGRPLSWVHALTLGLTMAVGASIGAPTGARLTHRLRLPHLRLAVAIALGISAAKMAGLF
ncbi:MAG: sulfite exporter TauE/SafE family protein [Phycisphaerales bacterium]|nr:sulfite exporter TauE/SafE family protein [Phycisphaerales bacterium]